jgi:hypothetical protein
MQLLEYRWVVACVPLQHCGSTASAASPLPAQVLRQTVQSADVWILRGVYGTVQLVHAALNGATSPGG